MPYLLIGITLLIAFVVVGAQFEPRARRIRLAKRAAAIARAAADAEGLRIRHHWADGKVDLDSNSLVIFYHVADDATLAAARVSGAEARLRERTLDALRAVGYPGTAAAVYLVSDETVNREGGASVYFR